MKSIAVLVKPVSGDCNIDCTYCFYKEELKELGKKSFGRMTRSDAHCLIDGVLNGAEESCMFAFQGGEPALAGLPFFEDWTEYVKRKKRPGLKVEYVFQTNGTLLDQSWFQFLKKHNFLLGVSLDGPKSVHDRYRLDYEGGGTVGKVCTCLDGLRDWGIPYHVLTVLTKDAAEKIERVYRFLKKQGGVNQQYIPCLEPEPRGGHPYSLRPEEYASCMKRLFDLWFQDYQNGEYVYIRQFENWVGAVKGCEPEACSQSGHCAVQHVVEADGSIYACDFYVTPAAYCGTIRDYSWGKSGEEQVPCFLEESRELRKSAGCETCRYHQVCRGGCRRDYIQTEEGRWENYYCTAYQELFAYIYERLKELGTFSFQ